MSCLTPTPSMSEEVHYPPSYMLALGNRLSVEQLAGPLLEEPIPFFVYGALQLPGILINYFKGAHEKGEMEMAQLMTPGRLAKHKVHAAYGTTYPAMIATEDAEDTVSGMIVFGASENPRQKFERHHAGCYNLKVVTVNMDLSSGETVSIVALTYIWARKRIELYKTSEVQWTLEGYILSQDDIDPIPPMDRNYLAISTSKRTEFSALEYALAHDGAVYPPSEDEEDESGFVSYTLKEWYR